MQAITLPRFLRRVLLADAATCVLMGAVLTLDTAALASPLGLPAALLFYAGAALFPIAAFILALLARPAIPAALVWLLIAGNIAWTADSLLLLATPWVHPTALGTAFVIAQAAAVALIAAVEYAGLRGSARTGSAVA